MEILTGLRKADSGEVRIHGKDVFNASPKACFDSGITSIPADRQKYGLVLDFSVAENLILQKFHTSEFSSHGILKRDKIESHARELIEKFDVPSLRM